MDAPADLRYRETHEWLRPADGRVGLTAHVVSELGDVAYVSLPDAGRRVAAGDAVAAVESTKAVLEVHAPASGTVVAVNDAVAATPELVDDDPYGEGWLFALDVEDAPELLSATAYRAAVG